MNQLTNIDMSHFWNGDGGENWIRFKTRLEQSLTQFGRQAITAANFSRGERVLDVGCGWGDTSVEIADIVGHEGKVQGIDISELILQRARDAASNLGFEHLSYECIDAESQHIENRMFDVIYSRFGVMFFNDPVAAFKNIRRSLKIGGRMIFICWQSVNANQWVRLPLDIVEKHITLAPPANPDAPGGFSFGDAIRVKRIIKQAGFLDVSIEPFLTQFNVGENSEEALTFLSHLGPASSVINDPEIHDANKSRIISDLRDILMTYKTTNGIELDAATWIVSARNT